MIVKPKHVYDWAQARYYSNSQPRELCPSDPHIVFLTVPVDGHRLHLPVRLGVHDLLGVCGVTRSRWEVVGRAMWGRSDVNATEAELERAGLTP